MKRFAYWFLCFLAFFSFALIIGGCAPKARPPVSTLGTPEHHVSTGMKFLESSKLLDAQREFELAKELDPKYSPASTGLGLVFAYKGDFNSAFDTMSEALELARSKQEEALVHVGFIRLYTWQKNRGWLEHAEEVFDRLRMTLKDEPDMPDPYFYMGLAYKEAYRFSDAAEAFRKVLLLNKAFTDKADRQLKLVQKILTAMPETPVGRRVALLEKVRRVDVAALFVWEFKLDTIYAKLRSEQSEISLESRDEGFPGQVPVPVDVRDHPLRPDIQTVIGLGVKGLGVFPDGSFAPNEFVTRADFAMMIADIIATVSRDSSLVTGYVGKASPFADVSDDVPYFSAVMVCTSRGIIEPRGGSVRQIIFDPRGIVSGADALLAIRRLKEDLRAL
jgi:hypothetical protein